MAVPSGNPASPDLVTAVFDRIAPVYDLMNTVMTGGTDGRWRAAAVRATRAEDGMTILDVACGTGKLTRALARAAGHGGQVIGIDRSGPMLERARRAVGRGDGPAPSYLAADAMALPFASARFDAVTVAFGLRNLHDYAAALAEMRRVLRPGGRLVVLEICEPRGGPAALLYRWWFQRTVPLLGRLSGNAAAYGYLPASLATYPAPDAVAALMREAGLERVRWRWLATGMATLHVGVAGPRLAEGT